MPTALRRRATSDAARENRREAILDAALALFEHIGFQDISMALLAERAGVAKGTLYLYFPTKEAVFLALYEREMAAWFEAMRSGLEQMEDNDFRRFAADIADSLDARRRLPALASLLHTVIERNVPFEDLLAFRQHQLETLETLGGRLEQKLSFIAPGDGVRLLTRVHALLMGSWQAASPAPIARRVLDEPGMAALRVDFSEEFENLLLLLLEGWNRSEGA